MENIEVFTKYPVINNDWVFYSSFGKDVNLNRLWGRSLGTEMMSVCLNANDVTEGVKSEIIKFNDVYDYYMRRGYMKRNAFMRYPGNQFMTDRVKEAIWKAYNIDPWNRQFPYFVDDVVSDYYTNSDNKIRYGYWVVYRDKVVSSKSMYMTSIINNIVPLMILTTTSIEGVTVACLDIVEE
jgi:hypothetical protein